MKKIFPTLLTITFICLSNSAYGMENTQPPRQIKNPLHHAACKGDLDAITLLLDQGAHVNQQDQKGATPLHCAAWYGHTEAVQLLLAAGAHTNLKEANGYTALLIATNNNHMKIIELLLNAETNTPQTNIADEDAVLLERVRNL